MGSVPKIQIKVDLASPKTSLTQLEQFLGGGLGLLSVNAQGSCGGGCFAAISSKASSFAFGI